MASVKLPEIHFDTTLADLYARGQKGSKDRARIALVPCGASSDIPFSTTFPRNSKYVYQDDVFMSNKIDTDPAELDKLRHVTSCLFLSVLAQRDAFIVGSMGVVHVQRQLLPRTATSRSLAEAELTMSVLPEHQLETFPHHHLFRPPSDQIPTTKSSINWLSKSSVMEPLHINSPYPPMCSTI